MDELGNQFLVDLYPYSLFIKLKSATKLRYLYSEKKIIILKLKFTAWLSIQVFTQFVPCNHVSTSIRPGSAVFQTAVTE